MEEADEGYNEPWKDEKEEEADENVEHDEYDISLRTYVLSSRGKEKGIMYEGGQFGPCGRKKRGAPDIRRGHRPSGRVLNHRSSVDSIEKFSLLILAQRPQFEPLTSDDFQRVCSGRSDCDQRRQRRLATAFVPLSHGIFFSFIFLFIFIGSTAAFTAGNEATATGDGRRQGRRTQGGKATTGATAAAMAGGTTAGINDASAQMRMYRNLNKRKSNV
ncbi:hypothetical protein EJ110_NYTH07073 [Nymphaea thermarum]|nr:hypothetical protein EJ110_NYTH07073 [Nymphaea thermarum]